MMKKKLLIPFLAIVLVFAAASLVACKSSPKLQAREILVKTPPTKLDCELGGVFDWSGGVLEVIYVDDSPKEIPMTDKEVEKDIDTGKAGPQTVTLTYRGASTTIDVTIKASQVVGMEIAETPRVNYFLGQDFDASVGKIKLIYATGFSELVGMPAMSTGWYSGFSTSSLSNSRTVTLKYSNKSQPEFIDSFNIVVNPNYATSIAVRPEDYQSKLFVGENLMVEQVMVTSANGKTEPVGFSSFTYSGYDKTKSGKQTVTISYAVSTLILTTQIEVEVFTVSSIELKLPNAITGTTDSTTLNFGECYVEIKNTAGDVSKRNLTRDMFDLDDAFVPDYLPLNSSEVKPTTFQIDASFNYLTISTNVPIVITITPLGETRYHLENIVGIDVSNGVPVDSLIDIPEDSIWSAYAAATAYCQIGQADLRALVKNDPRMLAAALISADVTYYHFTSEYGYKAAYIDYYFAEISGDTAYTQVATGSDYFTDASEFGYLPEGWLFFCENIPGIEILAEDFGNNLIYSGADPYGLLTKTNAKLDDIFIPMAAWFHANFDSIDMAAGLYELAYQMALLINNADAEGNADPWPYLDSSVLDFHNTYVTYYPKVYEAFELLELAVETNPIAGYAVNMISLFRNDFVDILYNTFWDNEKFVSLPGSNQPIIYQFDLLGQMLHYPVAISALAQSISTIQLQMENLYGYYFGYQDSLGNTAYYDYSYSDTDSLMYAYFSSLDMIEQINLIDVFAIDQDNKNFDDLTSFIFTNGYFYHAGYESYMTLEKLFRNFVSGNYCFAVYDYLSYGLNDPAITDFMLEYSVASALYVGADESGNIEIKTGEADYAQTMESLVEMMFSLPAQYQMLILRALDTQYFTWHVEGGSTATDASFNIYGILFGQGAAEGTTPYESDHFLAELLKAYFGTGASASASLAGLNQNEQKLFMALMQAYEYNALYSVNYDTVFKNGGSALPSAHPYKWVVGFAPTMNTAKSLYSALGSGSVFKTAGNIYYNMYQTMLGIDSYNETAPVSLSGAQQAYIDDVMDALDLFRGFLEEDGSYYANTLTLLFSAGQRAKAIMQEVRDSGDATLINYFFYNRAVSNFATLNGYVDATYSYVCDYMATLCYDFGYYQTIVDRERVVGLADGQKVYDQYLTRALFGEELESFLANEWFDAAEEYYNYVNGYTLAIDVNVIFDMFEKFLSMDAKTRYDFIVLDANVFRHSTSSWGDLLTLFAETFIYMFPDINNAKSDVYNLSNSIISSVYYYCNFIHTYSADAKSEFSKAMAIVYRLYNSSEASSNPALQSQFSTFSSSYLKDLYDLCNGIYDGLYPA